MIVADRTRETAAVVVPTPGARSTLRPLGLANVRLTGGLLHERQRMNREITLLHGARELERAGTLQNFRIAAGLAEGERRGMVFSDSDVYKFLEALAWEIARKPSHELEKLADDFIGLVAAAQLPDGYLNTYCQVVDPAWRWTDLEMGHELYCAGHLIQAAVAFVRATGDTLLLDVACRFADLLHAEFVRGSQKGTDGHPEVETALVELFRVTGQQRYLDLASTLIERRGQWDFDPVGQFDREYFLEAQPVRETRSIHGHAVRSLYLLAAVTDLYAETGDDDLLKSAVAQWDDLVSGKLYLTGGIGSRHFGEAIGERHELPPDRAYCETCAAIASIQWNWRLLLATGEARYADLMERTLYNGFLAGTGLSGDRFFYVNPMQSRGGHSARATWNTVACCPPNIMRLLASLQQYLATSDDDGLQVHHYTSAEVEADSQRAGALGIRVHTTFPSSGRIEVEITGPGDEEWTLSLRIPDWATSATIDGAPVEAGEYACLRRRWQTGDRVRVELNMEPRLTAPHPHIDAVRGCQAIERGPLVYCVEQADLPDGVELADIRLDNDQLPEDAGIAGPDLDSVTVVEFPAVVSGSADWGGHDYHRVDRVPATGVSENILMRGVPYFVWGNRGVGAMRVWIPVAGGDDRRARQE